MSDPTLEEIKEWCDKSWTVQSDPHGGRWRDYVDWLVTQVERAPKVQVADGDVFLHFPNAAISIEGICRFGAPGPIVKRNLRRWRDEILVAPPITPREEGDDGRLGTS